MTDEDEQAEERARCHFLTNTPEDLAEEARQLAEFERCGRRPLSDPGHRP